MKGLCLILALFILVCDCGIETYALDEVKVVEGKVVPKKIEYTMMEK